MNTLTKPRKLQKGDTIATISPCIGWAGDPAVRWKYELGVKRLQEIGLNVIAAPNSLKRLIIYQKIHKQEQKTSCGHFQGKK